MKTFTTENGIELPLMDLKGTPYLRVAYRILWFRKEHPDWSIQTSIEISEKIILAKATIIDSNGFIRAIAHRVEFDLKDTEKCETGAVGRALGYLGYGTQFAKELIENEGDKLADAPIAPIRTGNIPTKVIPNMAPGATAQSKPVNGGVQAKNTTSSSGKSETKAEPVRGGAVSEAQIKRYFAMTKALGWSYEDSMTHLRQNAGVSDPALISRENYTLITSKLQVQIDKMNGDDTDEIPF